MFHLFTSKTVPNQVKKMFFVLLLFLGGVSYGIQPLSTKDGFEFVFSGDSDPSISGVTIDGSSVSESVPNKGGFRTHFINEDSAIVMSGNIIENGDLTTSAEGWSSTEAFADGAGRDGTGAVCISTGQYVQQSFTFNESNKNSYGIKISGWSKAENVDGYEDSEYSLYMDIIYADGTPDYGITAQFPVGTHDYVYKERYHEFKNTVKSFTIYMLYRNPHTTGNVCFDDISVQLYELPLVSEGSITATNESSYHQVSTVYNSKLTVDYTAKDDHIQVSGNLESLPAMSNNNRSVRLSFSVPLNVSNDWTWGSGFTNIKLGQQACGSGSFTYSFNAFSTDRIFVAGISSGEAGIGIGVRPGSVFAFRLAFNGGAGLLTVSMEFALTPVSRIPGSAWFEFSLFKLDHPTKTDPFRSALDKYCKKVYADIYMQRVFLDQGLWMPFDKISDVEGWEDFGFKFYEGFTDLEFNTNNSIQNYPYIEPSMLHHGFYNEDPDEFFRLLKACNTTECNVTLASYITGSNGKVLYASEYSEWNNGVKIPTNGNPDIPGVINACKYHFEIVDNIYTYVTSAFKVGGIYVDSVEHYAYVLDYRSENFKYLGATPIYDDNHVPCTPFGSWTYDFLNALAQKLRTEKGPETTIMGNSVYAYFGHFASFIDVAGTETNWLRGDVYTPLENYILFYYRLNSFQKPYLFLMNVDFDVWSYDMTDKYMQKSLLYGMWPGFFSENAATNTYFSNPKLYNRDRPLFKKYIPVLKTITSQGWEPITCVVSSEINANNKSDAVLYVERWGGGNNELPVYFTMRAESSKSKAKYNVTIDLKCLGMENFKSSMFVTEFCQKNTGMNLVNNAYFEFEFESETTYAFKLEKGEWNAARSIEYKWHLLVAVLVAMFLFYKQ